MVSNNISIKTTLFFLCAASRMVSAVCPSQGETFEVEGICTPESVKAVCSSISTEAAKKGCDLATLQFMNIYDNHYQFDKEFMDGNTVLNDAASKPIETDRVSRVIKNVAGGEVIGWPKYEALVPYKERNGKTGEPYMYNFDLQESCLLATAMCCYTDNEGSDFEGNTDVCNQNLYDSKMSNHVSNGNAIHHSSGKTHCVGFSWADSIKGFSMISEAIRVAGTSKQSGVGGGSSSTLVDGDHSPSKWTQSPHTNVNSCSQSKYVQLDLGEEKYVSEVTLWHYYGDVRRYCGQKVELCKDSGCNDKVTVYDTGTGYGPTESAQGNTIKFPPTSAQYVRHYSSKSNKNNGVHFLEIAVKGGPLSTNNEPPTGGGSYGNPSTQIFMGNSLFEISYKYNLEKGYRKNVPGAPMCGCVERMPSVEDAACLTVTGEATYTFTYYNNSFIDGYNTASLKAGDCDGKSLKEHFNLIANSDSKIAEMDKYLVGNGNCEDSKFDYLNSMFLTKKEINNFEDVDESRWIQFAGLGLSWYPYDNNKLAEQDEKLRSLFENSPNKIIRRYCESCSEQSHRDIYYKRITELPSSSELNFYDLFMSEWNSKHNELNKDFKLYSSYDDALNDENEWKFCNYNVPKIGFPRDCGPSGHVGCMWNSLKVGMCTNGPHHHGFYVEAS